MKGMAAQALLRFLHDMERTNPEQLFETGASTISPLRLNPNPPKEWGLKVC